jgi:hypothetical protein
VSEQRSTQHQPIARTGPGTRDQPAHRLRVLGLVAVCLGVAALAGAAFVLSYSGIRDVAMDAGVPRQRAGDYPVLIDAMLVIALLAVLGLRGAGLPSRIFSWLALLCVLAAGAGADVQNATGHTLRYTAAATTAAVLPWALVFIAFVLLFALLRHATLRRQASVARRRAALGADQGLTGAAQQTAEPGLAGAARQTADLGPAGAARQTAHPEPAGAAQQTTARTASPLPVRIPQPWNSASIVPGFTSRLVSSAAAGAAAGAAAAAAEQPGDDSVGGLPETAHADQEPAGAGGALPETAHADQGPADAGGSALPEPAQADQQPADGDVLAADAGVEAGQTDGESANGPAEPADDNELPGDASGVEAVPSG